MDAKLAAWLQEADTSVTLADGFDEALVGIAQIFNQHVAIYDRGRCLAILQRRDGMTVDEAEEFFDFNVVGAYVGPETPGFLVWRR